MQQPLPFLAVRVHDLSKSPGLTGLCTGYEQGAWRCDQLVRHAFQWLPEFALKSSESRSISSHNCVEMMQRAADRVYKSKKFRRRGEFGELFLHIAIRQVFKSKPAISKLYYKTGVNDTVKGFDAVHVVPSADGFELWLGEAKFFKNANAAIKKVASEIMDHMKHDYLRDEFILISDKVDDSDDFAEKLKLLLSQNTSIDQVFERACIPVFITYDSKCVAGHKSLTKAYEKAFEQEIQSVYGKFAQCTLPSNVQIHLFLMPLESKDKLVAALDAGLKRWQNV